MWEVALIKAMLKQNQCNDQDILAHFTRPSRSINHGRIAEIRTGARFSSVEPASDDQLDDFLECWPNVDPETGLCIRGDELLIKAREAMIAAVHTFNGGGLYFRAELFVVTAIIAWTYLLHAWFRRQRIDYRYKDAKGSVIKTKQGADRYWDLAKCLRQQNCPISDGANRNLRFLLELRHEIEHRSTSRIDDTIGAKLQACCKNFNAALKEHFDERYGLEGRLPIALQFGQFSPFQRSALKNGGGLPQHIKTSIDTFESELSKQEYEDPAYRYRVAFVPLVSNRSSSADHAVEIFNGVSVEGKEVDRVLLKEVDRSRYTATEVCQLMQSEGYPGFTIHAHIKLWQEQDAKNPAKGLGKPGDYNNTWVWNDKWIKKVRDHCQEHGDKYRN